jgi:hypothetical protein
MAKNLKLTNVRIAFARLFEPKLNQSKTAEEYSVCIILDPENPTTQALQEAVDDVATEKWGEKAVSLLEKGRLRDPIHDGDDMESGGEAFAGKLYCNAKSRRAPQIVDRKVQPIIDQDEIYSGCYCNITVSLYAYDKPENKGIGIGLNNIQLIKRGERLSGAPDAEEEFEVLEDTEEEAPKKRGRPRKEEEEAPKNKAEYEDEEEFEAPKKAPTTRRRTAK